MYRNDYSVHGFRPISFGRGTISCAEFASQNPHLSSVRGDHNFATMAKAKEAPRGHQAVLQRSYQAHLAAQSCRMEASEDVFCRLHVLELTLIYEKLSLTRSEVQPRI
jgi:hypothetical protein